MARLPSPACQGFTQMAVSSCTLVGVCVQELLFCRDQEQACLLLVPHSSFLAMKKLGLSNLYLRALEIIT